MYLDVIKRCNHKELVAQNDPNLFDPYQHSVVIVQAMSF